MTNATPERLLKNWMRALLLGAEPERALSGAQVWRWALDGFLVCHEGQSTWLRVQGEAAERVLRAIQLPVLRPGIPILLGGDDGSQVGQNPTTHRGFPRITQQLMIAENRWLPGPNFLPAVVTAPVVQTEFGAVIASGEIRPGIRSPAVWLLRETTP